MNPDKFKSVALKIDAYNKLYEYSNKCFPMPISLSMTVGYLINLAHQNWKNGGGKKIEYDPYPEMKLRDHKF